MVTCSFSNFVKRKEKIRTIARGKTRVAYFEKLFNLICKTHFQSAEAREPGDDLHSTLSCGVGRLEMQVRAQPEADKFLSGTESGVCLTNQA